MIGAYIALLLLSIFGLPPVVSIPVAAGICAGLGWLVYVGIFRKLLATLELAQRLEANSLILFYGVSVILQNAAALAFSSTSRGYRYMNDVHHFGGVLATGNRLILLGVATAISLGVLLFLRLHLFGWSLRAVIERRDAAAGVGVDVDRVQGVTICGGFAIAGMAGVVGGQTAGVFPVLGVPFSILCLCVLTLVGVGDI